MEIVILLFLIVLNGVFSLSEAAVISSRSALLSQYAAQGKRSAESALALIRDPNTFLSTVQVGITLIGLVTGAFGGTALGGDVGAWLTGLPIIGPVIAPYASAVGVGLVVVVSTYLSVVVGELVPKRIALQNSEGIAMMVAEPMWLLSRITSPVVALLSSSTQVVTRVMGLPDSSENRVTEGEIMAMVLQSAAEGGIDREAGDMVKSVFALDDTRLVGVMTPRLEIDWLNLRAPCSEWLDIIYKHNYSAYPVCDGDLENVVGMVRTKTLLVACLQDTTVDLKTLLQTPLYLPDSLTASQALAAMRQMGTETALVIDEYGGLDGLVTVRDLLEEIVGELDIAKPLARQRDDGSWLLDGGMSVEELAALFAGFAIPESEARQYVTVAGFVLARLGRVPMIAEHFEWGGVYFEVLDMDGQRIDKVLACYAPADQQAGG